MAASNPRNVQRFAPKIPSAEEDATARLERVFSTRPELADFLRRAERVPEPVLLVINDSHRATLTREALTALKSVQEGLGLDLSFDVLVACGTHEFSASERRAFESAMLENTGLIYRRVEWHDSRATRELTPIGPFRFHARLAERKFLLPIGSAEPHYFAGITGPHKTVTIGCMGYEDIRANHRGAMEPTSEILRLEGNPVHEGVVAALEALHQAGKHICAIGEVVAEGALIAACVGHPTVVVRELEPVVRSTFVHEVAAPFDLLNLKVPPPLGRNLYQADKALKNNHRAVRDGGGILLEAACPEGIGPNAFLRLLRRAGTLAAARALVAREGYVLGDHKAIKLRELIDPAARGVRVALVSGGVDAADARAAGMEAFPHAEAARAWLHERLGGTVPREAVIEDAGNVTVTAGGT